MEVEKRTFRTQYVRNPYVEARWPGARVAHRIQPHARIYERTYEKLAMNSASTLKATHSMLHILMDTIQNYLLLNGNDKERGALTSWELVDSTAQVREDNRIWRWLEDVQTQR